MANRAYILLFAICIQFGPSLQQLRTLGKRLDYMELMINSMTLKTQFDISELRDAIELLNNKTEGESSAHVDVSSFDAAAIAGLESEMKKTVNQHDLTITAIAKAVSDEKKYARKQMKALELVKETIANQSIDKIESDLMATTEMNSKLKKEVHEVKSDLMATKEMNSKLKKEVRKVKSDLMKTNSKLNKEVHEVKSDLMATKEMNSKLKKEVREVKSDLMATKEINSKLTKEVEENKKDILELRQLITEKKKTELGYSSAAVTVPAHLLTCPDGWRKFKDTCYLHVKKEWVTWDVAKTRCAERGGKLAEPDTEEKIRFVLSQRYIYTWLGGTDRQTEGTWVWSSSKRRITFFPGWSGEPENYGGRQDCLRISRRELHDFFCKKLLRYVCEKQANV